MKPNLPSLTVAFALLAAPQFVGAAKDAAIDMKLADIREVANAGPFEAKWDSLADYEIPEWYQDAKFGIFIHWGMYSVPGYGNEWYPREMYRQKGSRRGVYDYHQEKYGPDFGYKDFIPMFKAEKFDPDAWAQLFKDATTGFPCITRTTRIGTPQKWDPSATSSLISKSPSAPLACTSAYPAIGPSTGGFTVAVGNCRTLM